MMGPLFLHEGSLNQANLWQILFLLFPYFWCINHACLSIFNDWRSASFEERNKELWCFKNKFPLPFRKHGGIILWYLLRESGIPGGKPQQLGVPFQNWVLWNTTCKVWPTELPGSWQLNFRLFDQIPSSSMVSSQLRWVLTSWDNLLVPPGLFLTLPSLPDLKMDAHVQSVWLFIRLGGVGTSKFVMCGTGTHMNTLLFWVMWRHLGRILDICS